MCYVLRSRGYEYLILITMKINIEQIKEIIRTVNKTTVLIYKDGTRQEFTGAVGMDIFKSLK